VTFLQVVAAGVAFALLVYLGLRSCARRPSSERPRMAQIAIYLAVLLVLARPLGAYLARVYQGRPCGLDRVLGPVERLLYRACRARPDAEQGWKAYAAAMLVFNLVGFLAVYAIQRCRPHSRGTRGRGCRLPDSSFNTAMSFARTRTGRATAASRRCRTPRRCSGLRCRTS